MNRKVIFGDCGQLSCPYCHNTLIDCKEDYERCYTGIQGSKDKNDNGDEWDCGRFNTLKEANAHFNTVKKNVDGIVKIPGGYLETSIALSIYNTETDCQTDNIMKSYKFRY